MILPQLVWPGGEERGVLGDETSDETLQNSFEVGGGATI